MELMDNICKLHLATGAAAVAWRRQGPACTLSLSHEGLGSWKIRPQTRRECDPI